MSQKVNPLLGRAAELNEYATSDLSVEENLAGGASVDDLMAAGVLYDDYDPDSRDFTPLPTEQEIATSEAVRQGPAMSEATSKAQIQAHFKYGNLAAKFRKEANQRRTWT